MDERVYEYLSKAGKAPKIEQAQLASNRDSFIHAWGEDSGGNGPASYNIRDYDWPEKSSRRHIIGVDMRREAGERSLDQMIRFAKQLPNVGPASYSPRRYVMDGGQIAYTFQKSKRFNSI